MARFHQSVGEYLRSAHGVEAVQLYLWLCKDVIWTQCSFWLGYVAIAVMVPSILLLYMSRRDPAQCLTYLVLLVWLAANWWWMVGENWDCRFHPNSDVVEHSHVELVQALLAVAFVFFLAHQSGGRAYIHSRCPPPEGAEIKGATSPRRTLEMLQTLRGVRTRVDDYESFHVLFWIGKDLAWALDFKWMWLFFGVGTLVLAADLVFLMRRDLVELTHAVVTLIWVSANVTWGASELFAAEEHPAPMGQLPSPLTNGRWYAAWMLVLAMLPVAALYATWVRSTHADASGPEMRSLVKPGAETSAPPPPTSVSSASL